MNVFDLCAKLTLDKKDYETGLDGAKGALEKVGSAMATIGKVGAIAIGAGATAVGALGKQAIEAYADYEQLTGGVETLFKESAGVVMGYADMAYETAGLSANEYMETVTSFSASLLQSLGGDTEKSAEKANQAIIDMSDNANKMGSSMESIQNAYSGFAKQNYTMLDNLKLGYGGTKEEMQRLLEDAGKLANTKFNIESYSDVIDAIHVIQESMDITGTTAKEASTTISGSISMMKSQWANMLTAIANGDDWDMGVFIDNFIATVETVAQNVLPVVEKSLKGIGELIKGLAPYISELLPVLVTDVLPSILEAGAELVSSMGGALLDNIDLIIDTGFELLNGLIDGIVNNLPKIIDACLKIITKLVDSLTDGGNLEKITRSALTLITQLAVGLIKALPKLVASIPKIVLALQEGFIDWAKDMFPAGASLIDGLWNGIKSCWNTLVNNVKNLANGLISTVKGIFGIHSPSKVFANIGEMCVAGLEDGSEGLFSSEGLTAKVSASVDSKTTSIGSNNDVISLLQQYLPTIASGNQIILDTGALVGSTAKAYNAELGRLALRGANL